MLRIFTESNSSTAGSGIIRLKEIVNRLDFLGTIGSSFTSYLIFIVCETGQCLSTLSMATTICKFSEKVRKKVGNKEENNNNESLVCDVCSVVCKSTANLRKHQQRTHDDRDDWTCVAMWLTRRTIKYLENSHFQRWHRVAAKYLFHVWANGTLYWHALEYRVINK